MLFIDTFAYWAIFGNQNDEALYTPQMFRWNHY